MLEKFLEEQWKWASHPPLASVGPLGFIYDPSATLCVCVCVCVCVLDLVNHRCLCWWVRAAVWLRQCDLKGRDSAACMHGRSYVKLGQLFFPCLPGVLFSIIYFIKALTCVFTPWNSIFFPELLEGRRKSVQIKRHPLMANMASAKPLHSCGSRPHRPERGYWLLTDIWWNYGNSRPRLCWCGWSHLRQAGMNVLAWVSRQLLMKSDPERPHAHI